MRVVVCLTSLLLASCSSVLGIQDPGPGSDAGSDASIDAPMAEHLRFNVGDFKIAQGQRLRLRVEHVHTDGSVEDVTSRATYASDNTALAMVTSGTLESGTQAGTATITASLNSLTPVTVKATVTDVVCHPVINELRTASAASASDEWVEIYNSCTSNRDVTNWTLVYRGNMTLGTKDDALLITLSGEMAPGALRLYAGNAYSGRNDGKWSASGGLGRNTGAVGLRGGPQDTGALVDSVGYGVPATDPNHPFVETTSLGPMNVDVSASRLIDGKDEENNSTDFVIGTSATPDALNAP